MQKQYEIKLSKSNQIYNKVTILKCLYFTYTLHGFMLQINLIQIQQKNISIYHNI